MSSQFVVGAQTLAAMLVVSLLGLIVLYALRRRSITFVLTATRPVGRDLRGRREADHEG